MDKSNWLLEQIKQIETLAAEMGRYDLVHGLRHTLEICAQEAGLSEGKHELRSAKFETDATKVNCPRH